MFGSLDISTSALVAQRTRMEVIAANLANKDAIVGPDGEYSPYRRRITVFASGDPSTGSPFGVHLKQIALDQSELLKKSEPGSPFADENGMVGYPNVHPTIELANAVEASRAYEANITAAEATKSMLQSSLRLLT